LLAKDSVISQEDLRMLLYEISKNFQHTLSLLENLLSWSKSQMEEETINPVSISLSEISQEALALIEKKAQEKGIILKNNISSDIIAYADNDMISLVFRNLVNNAVKFCREGDAITLNAEIKENHCEVCVFDTGVGIPSNRIQNLFGIENSSTKGTANEKGTGLGLILCAQFLKQNNGKIWVESSVGNGSKFYFSLPLPPKN
jgi:signal transduction histidine kinase